jgi:hypothetical protein
MKFAELSEQDKIQAVKDQFVSIVEAIHLDSSKLKKYIKLEETKLSEPILEVDDGSDPTISARNELAKTAMNIANEKASLGFKTQKEIFDKILTKVSSLKKKEECKCGSCLDVNLTSGIVIGELEPLIDAARLEVQNKSF